MPVRTPHWVVLCLGFFHIDFGGYVTWDCHSFRVTELSNLRWWTDPLHTFSAGLSAHHVSHILYFHGEYQDVKSKKQHKSRNLYLCGIIATTRSHAIELEYLSHSDSIPLALFTIRAVLKLTNTLFSNFHSTKRKETTKRVNRVLDCNLDHS